MLKIRKRMMAYVMLSSMIAATISSLGVEGTEVEKPDPTQKVGVTCKNNLGKHYQKIIQQRIKSQKEHNKDLAHKITKPLISEKRKRDALKVKKREAQQAKVYTQELILNDPKPLSSEEVTCSNQTGLVADYTHFSTQNWGGYCRRIFNKWISKGKKTKRGIATIDGYYLVATKPRFGAVGDRINIILEDGTIIKAIQADVKGNEHQNEWGHFFGNGTSLVEWELDNSRYSSPDLSGWQGKKVNKINNLGNYI